MIAWNQFLNMRYEVMVDMEAELLLSMIIVLISLLHSREIKENICEETNSTKSMNIQTQNMSE